MRCDALTEMLAEAAEGQPVSGRAARAHVEHCLRCQADLAQHRRLHRSLRQLADRRVSAPADWVEEVLAALDEANTRRARETLRDRLVRPGSRLRRGSGQRVGASHLEAPSRGLTAWPIRGVPLLRLVVPT
jgi:hypothetical protein